ncbi:beta-lactamase family protein, partial [Alphaproteobacteria bacterium]|nr:beta-lactamase family protein [Alphaproteobacteria bacterium]
MRRRTRILVSLFAIGLLAASGGLFRSSHSLQFDDERLKRIDAHYRAAIDNQIVAGVRALIVQNDRTVYERNFGYRDIAGKKPMTDDTIFHIYSMTKPITSVAVMILFEEGKLLLHEPIAKYIPELADLKVYDPVDGKGNPPVRKAARQPTVNDLLTHRAGFTYGLFDRSALGAKYRKADIGGPTTDLEGMVEELGKLPLAF